LPTEDSSRVIRFANRVPLLFQQSACSSFKAVAETNWRNYDLQQPRGSSPVGPIVIMIHMASVWVPFTSESKEAIADYDEIRKEMKLALMECGRKLGTYLRKRAKMKREGERRDVFQKYIGEITNAINAINGADKKKLYEVLLEQARKRTAIADLQLDEEGKRIKEEDPADQEGVLVVESAAPPAARSKAEAAMLAVAGMDEDEQRTNHARQKAAKEMSGKVKDASEPKLLERGASRAGEGAAGTKAGARAKGTPKSPDVLVQKVPKPRMRLINGKSVPVDEQGNLF
jgi:hypothetical protein